MIRVALVDDQELIRAGLRMTIDAEADLAVVGEAASGDQAVDLVAQTRADVVLMDIRMPGMDGIAATRALTDDDRFAGVKIVILTTFELDDYVIDAIRAGASGFISKSIGPTDLVDAIRVVAGGDALLSPRATAALVAALADARDGADADADGGTVDEAVLAPLTPREREVMALVASGLTNDEIAETLYVSPLTAKTHVNRAMAKLGARDRAQLVVIAFESGLVRPTPR